MADDPLFSPQAASYRATRWRSLLLSAALAFVLGGAIVVWLAWRGDLARLLPSIDASPEIVDDAVGGKDVKSGGGWARVGAMETRLAILDDRLARINLQASAASGNATHAEDLLVAAAVRRLVERGAPLGAFDAQLRARFGTAQPGAVRLLSGYSAHGATRDQLDIRLGQLAPSLAQVPHEAGSWTRMRERIADLFVVRSDPAPTLTTEERVGRARLMLRLNRVDDAVGEVVRMPGAASAADWITDARRYAAAQQALDAIDSAALANTSSTRPAPAPATNPPG